MARTNIPVIAYEQTRAASYIVLASMKIFNTPTNVPNFTQLYADWITGSQLDGGIKSPEEHTAGHKRWHSVEFMDNEWVADET